ncbi:MAG: hypothetical protein OSB21_09695, partial [Myxococcota bacterium]|nr:hypothetical protein [Myxococcota bacterium]
MNDPIAILLILVLIGAAVGLWMLDGMYRGRLIKSAKRAADAEASNAKLESQLAHLREEASKNKQRLERLEKDRDGERYQVRKLRAKVKRQGKGASQAETLMAEDGAERLNSELRVLRLELEHRLEGEQNNEAKFEALSERLADARARNESMEAQAKVASRGVRVKLVDSEVEAAKEDLPAFMKRIKTEMVIIERKAIRSHEAFMSQRSETDLAVEKLTTMRERYRAVCRELAVLLSGNEDIDHQEAKALAEKAVEQADDAASWG